MQLRDYQQSAIANIRNALRAGKRRVMLQLPTGAGKTFTAGSIISSAVDKGSRVLFVVDTLELLEQALYAFDSMGLDCGVMQGMHERTDTSAMVQVCTAQTLASRLKRHAHVWGGYPVGLIIIDEAHVQYSAHRTLAEIYDTAPVIGLSATPFSKGLGKFYDHLVIGVTPGELMSRGVLTQVRVFSPSMPDLKGVKTKSNGDWQESGLAEAYDGELIADIVSTWKRSGEGRQTLVFASNVAHSKRLCEEFQAAGVNAAHIDGYSTSDEDKIERYNTIKAFKRGDINVLCNVAILTKGFDYPAVSCLVIARPTKSLSMHLQVLGRGIRAAEGKEDCIVLDHAGNVVRNGFPDDATPDELCDGEKGNSVDRKPKDATKPKECPKCKTVKKPGVHKCPNCGFAPERKSEIETREGELVELGKKANKETSWDEKIKFMGGLKHYADQRGFKRGWADHKYKEKFGVWPNDPRVKKATATQPSTDVIGFLRHLNIKNAKRSQAKSRHSNA